jgi:hypothetical protein
VTVDAAVAGPWTHAAVARLVIGDIALDRRVVDAYGVKFIITRLQGWDDGWQGSATSTPRQSAHGSWPSPVWAAGRVVQADGRIEAGTWDAATLAWERLLAAVPLSRLTTMTVETGEGGVPARQAAVRQAGSPLVSKRTHGYLMFSLSLEAPDPRRYSVVELASSTGLPVTTGGLRVPIRVPVRVNATVTSGRVTVTNDGNEAAPVALEVTGPCPAGATVTNLTTGQQLTIPEAVPAGQVLVLDSRAKTARIDGVAARTVTGTWFDLLPGANELAFGAPAYDAAAQLTIRYRHAWR